MTVRFSRKVQLPADATFRRLTFAGDFPTRTLKPPPAGATAIAALTVVGHSLAPSTFHFDRAKFLKGRVFLMREDPNVTVTLDKSRMFVASWALARPQPFPTALLNHEQGHYEIGMLNAKDFFFALLGIQATAFGSPRAGITALLNLQATLGSAQAIQNKYDLDTTNGLKPARQAAWDAALLAARTTFTAPSLRVALGLAGLFPLIRKGVTSACSHHQSWPEMPGWTTPPPGALRSKRRRQRMTQTQWDASKRPWWHLASRCRSPSPRALRTSQMESSATKPTKRRSPFKGGSFPRTQVNGMGGAARTRSDGWTNCSRRIPCP